MVLGEHGDSMTPILSRTTIKGKKLSTFLTAKEVTPLVKTLKASAKTIRKTEEATKHGVAQCAVELMNLLTSGSTESFVASVKVPDSLKSKFGLKSNAYMSLPCLLSNNQLQAKTTIEMDKSELESLKKAASILEKAILLSA